MKTAIPLAVAGLRDPTLPTAYRGMRGRRR
jgi:hypothetical protein